MLFDFFLNSGFNDVVYCQNIRHSAKELDRLLKTENNEKSQKLPSLSISNPNISKDGASVVVPRVRYDLPSSPSPYETIKEVDRKKDENGIMESKQ